MSVANPFTAMSGGGTPAPAGSSCVPGVNYPNGDMPRMPDRGVTSAAACEAACKASAQCVGYVWNSPGCEGTPAPGNCFFKAILHKVATHASLRCKLLTPL